jgi:hypothetical protein
MPARGEFRTDLFTIGRLKRQHAFERERTRHFGCRLNIHAKIEHVGEEVGVTGCLIMSTHHTERHHAAPILHHHAGNDGVHRPLVRTERIGMAGLQAEAPATIVQQHAGFRRIQRRAESVEDRVDEGARIAVAIDHGDVDRVAMIGQVEGLARRGAVQRDRAGERADARIRQRRGDVDAGLRRIGDDRVALAIGRLGGLGVQMDPVGLAQARIRHFEPLQNAGDDQRGEALSVRRAFKQLAIAITRRNRRLPGRALAGEILFCVKAAEPGEKTGDLPGDRAFVERRAAAPGDGGERRGEGGMLHPLARPRRPPAGQIVARRRFAARQPRDLPTPVVRDARSDAEALACGADRRSQRIGEALAAESRGQRLPGVDGPRNGHRMRRGIAEFPHAVLGKSLQPRPRRGAARAVEGGRRAAGGPVQDETVAADAGHVRIDDALDGGGGDRRVGRIAAGAQEIERGERGGGVGGRDHRLAGDRGGAAGPGEIARQIEVPGDERATRHGATPSAGAAGGPPQANG